MGDLCYVSDYMKSARNTRESVEPGAADQRMSREGVAVPLDLPTRPVRASQGPTGPQLVQSTLLLRGLSRRAPALGEMARELDSMDTGVNAASARIPWSRGPRGSRELPASFQVQLPRHTCAHVLALCIYTVHVESRFIYCNVKIYFPFLKDHGNAK